jgi:MoxR-like ATPase
MKEDTAAEQLIPIAERMITALGTVLVGQRAALEGLLAAYMAEGHVLLEGVPGVGKTRLARGFAALLGLQFARVQFTPDLMPTDVMGMNVFDPASGRFRLVRGPVFTQIFMADEINRTPPKTQSALLEAMQELQVTIDGARLALDPAFFVVATSNPVEFEGTYPLPEAQIDRFILRVQIGLPEEVDEVEIYRLASEGRLESDPGLAPILAPDEAQALRRASRQVHLEPGILEYLARLASAVRKSPHVDLGVSPRGGLALLATARATALLAGRDFVTPDDVKRCLVPCWAHRLILNVESELEGHSAQGILEEASRSVEVPR